MKEDIVPANIGSKINYKFNHFRMGVDAFIANLEKKLQYIVDDLPVYVLNTGDSSYWFQGKWTNQSGDTARRHTEIYQKVPRVVLEFDDFQFNTDQNTNQYTQFQYKWNDAEWNAKGRRQATTIPFNLNWVCPNQLIAMDCLEVLAAIMCIDNTFTYNVNGNTYQGSFASQSFSMEKGAVTADGSPINSNIKCVVDVVLQPMLVRYETIQPLSDAKLSSQVNIIALGPPDYIDALNPVNPDDPTLTKNDT
jgi:hypothetical protein